MHAAALRWLLHHGCGLTCNKHVYTCLRLCCLSLAFPAQPKAVVNLDNVRSVPGLGLVTRIPFVTQVLQGILPTIGEGGLGVDEIGWVWEV